MELNKLIINETATIKEAIRLIDNSGMGIGFVVDVNKRFLGTVTDGDIRRAILDGVSIEKLIVKVICKDSIFINKETKDQDILNLKNRAEVKTKMPPGGFLKVPVLGINKEVVDVVLILSGEKEFTISKETPKLNKVLVIGGAGYLGSVLCRKLLNSGYKVKVLDNLTYGESGIKELYQNPNFKFLKGDIRNISDIVEGIRDVDAVIHLAAIVGDPACEANPKETLEINYLATKNVVETCKYFQVNRFIFASTCSVYGKSLVPDEKLNEKSLLNPVSLYAETKIKCEKAILDAIDENFSPTILRMATLYGYSKNMRFDLAVNIMTAKALFDKEIIVFGGNQWRPWLHLEDAASAYLACLEKPLESIEGQTFNLLSENYKIIDVGKIINSICKDSRLQLSPQVVDQRNYNVSPDKICQFLGFVPVKKISDGVNQIKEEIEKGSIKTYKSTEYRVISS
jgi:nucleoside-diphosphate-sugar epimerase/CBS domain-containing protein